MSVTYCTVPELASFLQKDLDTASATLAIQTASELFSRRAQTWWALVTATWEDVATGIQQLRLPFRPVTAVSAIRIVTAAGVSTAITDWSLIRNVLYRLAGFGTPGAFPPDKIQVDLTYGYAAATDDVKGAVLETAGTAYQGPDLTVQSEAVDDYKVVMAANIGGLMLTESAAKLADMYRGTFLA